MVIFHSYVKSPEGKTYLHRHWSNIPGVFDAISVRGLMSLISIYPHDVPLLRLIFSPSSKKMVQWLCYNIFLHFLRPPKKRNMLMFLTDEHSKCGSGNQTPLTQKKSTIYNEVSSRGFPGIACFFPIVCSINPWVPRVPWVLHDAWELHQGSLHTAGVLNPKEPGSNSWPENVSSL